MERSDVPWRDLAKDKPLLQGEVPSLLSTGGTLHLLCHMLGPEWLFTALIGLIRHHPRWLHGWKGDVQLAAGELVGVYV